MKSYQKALRTKKQLIEANDTVNLKRLNNQIKYQISKIEQEADTEIKTEYLKEFKLVLSYKGEIL